MSCHLLLSTILLTLCSQGGYNDYQRHSELIGSEAWQCVHRFLESYYRRVDNIMAGAEIAGKP